MSPCEHGSVSDSSERSGDGLSILGLDGDLTLVVIDLGNGSRFFGHRRAQSADWCWSRKGVAIQIEGGRVPLIS